MKQEIIEILNNHAFHTTQTGLVVGEDKFDEMADEILRLFGVMQRSEQVCSKCGCKKVCEWCDPFNQPIPPEGIVL